MDGSECQNDLVECDEGRVAWPVVLSAPVIFEKTRIAQIQQCGLPSRYSCTSTDVYVESGLS